MALAVKKIFVVALIIEIAILAYFSTILLSTNGIRWLSVSSLGIQLPQHNFNYNDADVFVQPITISKNVKVSSSSSVTDWPSRTQSWNETTYMPSNKSGGGEPTRSTKAEGNKEETVDQHHIGERIHLDDTKTRAIFQQIDDKQAWLYSAFFDHVAAQRGKPSVRIFGIVNRNLLHTVYCNLTTRDGIVIMTGNVIELPDSHGVSCPPSYIECGLPANTRPTHVSISFRKYTTATNRLQIIYPGSLIRNFTVCYSVLHSHFNSASQLIESLEMNLILGAEHFLVYNYSVSPAVDQILRRYQEEGLLTVLPWSVPTKQSWYFGQMIALNDCFYRNRNISRFVVVVDTDEFMIPKNHSNWMELIAAASAEEYDVSTFVHSTSQPKKAQVKTGCFLVSSSFFSTSSKTNWILLPSKFPFSEEEKNNTIRHIFTLSKFLRCSEMFPYGRRTKYIARPELTYNSGIHRVNTFVNFSTCLNITSNLSLVHHYRTRRRGRYDVLDTTMLKFKRQLYPRVIERFKLFPSIFPSR